MNTWFRYYNEALDDPKVQKLPPKLFKYWVNLLCICSKNDGKIPDLKDTAFRLRLTEEQAAAALSELEDRNLIHSINGGYVPHAWEKRQFKSDGSTERVQRFRAKQGNVTETLRETGPDTDTDTDTDTEQKKSPLIPLSRKSLKCVPEPMPVNDADRVWATKNHISVDLESETAAMIDWAHSKSVRRADWNATRRNWWREAQRRTKGTANVKLDRQERNAQAARRLLSRLHPENGSGLQRGLSGIDAVDLPRTLAPVDGRANPNGSKPHD